LKRVALISDIHANEAALQAVLDDIAKVGVDQIVCLGDVATLGPRPSFVIEELERLGCVCIEGNHDAFLLDAQLIHSYTEAPVIVEAVDWCRDQMNAAELNFVKTFRSSAEIPLDGRSTLFVFHGSPRSHMEDILATTSAEDVDVALEGAAATVLAGGHTHIQMLRQHRGMLIVNPGSVGLPFREYAAGKVPTLLMHSEYAIVEAAAGRVNVNMRRVGFDLDAARQAVSSSKNPLSSYLLQQYSA
jgi:putative phosphoesterase